MRECSRELIDIEGIINAAPLDPKVQYLTMYALIKSCGTVEYIFKSIISDFCDRTRITQIQQYIDQTVREASTSPKYSNICGLLKKFDDNWCTNFKAQIDIHPNKGRLISSIDSLVTNRHQFAHGRNPTVSFLNLMNYYNDAVVILNILDSVVR